MQQRITPRNQFNERLSQRYTDIPTDIPKAVPYNTPVGTHFCDRRPFYCHPQEYGTYRNVPVESVLRNLDYYNLNDVPADCRGPSQTMSPELNQQFNQQRVCPAGPRLFRNNTKLWKYGVDA
jgi:hypothetical protein